MRKKYYLEYYTRQDKNNGENEIGVLMVDMDTGQRDRRMRYKYHARGRVCNEIKDILIEAGYLGNMCREVSEDEAREMDWELIAI